MKRLCCILLALALAALMLTGCDRRSETTEDAASGDPNFSPETTAVGGLTQAVEEQSSGEAEDATPIPAVTVTATPEDSAAPTDPPAVDQPIDAEGAAPDVTATATPENDYDSPFATPTPQPNASVSQYTEIAAPGLGFRFSYPTGWVNIPGRSTVCYVQPLEDGTVYPARVAVTMKRMPHTTSYDEARTELANYIRTLMTQYDSSTFKVNTNLDLNTKFMGKRAISTTYLAYDGNQEIKGYTIITYFERYLFVFHFLCAYEDYTSFEATLRYMRDSVQADSSVAPE